jgi:hypothetical protein
VMIPMENKLQKSCFHCCRALKGEQTSKQTVSVSTEETVSCSACGSKYCSQRCKEEATPLHTMECPYIPKLREIAKQTEVEFCFVCFLVRLLIRRYLELSKSKYFISLKLCRDIIQWKVLMMCFSSMGHNLVQ